MINKRVLNVLAIAGISALADASYATQPPCATSDGGSNTACGTGALAVNAGAYNTAAGFYALFSNTTGANNTASGDNALVLNTTGAYNTASGANALRSNTTGAYNTASGAYALRNNTTGAENTASGVRALNSNTTGAYNTASGVRALISNTTGGFNTASGADALHFNTTGAYNTASGFHALLSNTTGELNIASGAYALFFNSSGSNTAAVGSLALYNSTTGTNNAAVGYKALYANTTGNYGTALGYEALYNSQAGLGNIGVGPFAGRNIVQGQLNIDIGSWGTADESNTIRIGIPQYHRTTYIAGIGNSAIAGGTPVVVNLTTGQLGYAGSSERYKTDISSLGSATSRLAKLRPVQFRIKADPNGAIQYGLIAEEVDKVYPELVIRDNEGKIQGVRYDELAPMLLNEMQKQQVTIAAQTQHAVAQDAKIRELRRQVAMVHELKQRLDAVLQKLPAKDGLVAQR
jgi:trimeric autotransporter adhesin